MAAGTAYAKRFAGGFADNAGGGTPIDSAFLNAVETALLQLISAAPTADGQVAQWDNANTRFGPALLLNKNVDPAAAIAKSKLDLTGANGIVNADIAGAAAIARSKLSFGSGLVDADIATAAALAIAKLAGYPSDGTKFLAGDATWKQAGALTLRKTTAKAVNTTAAATDLLNGEITLGAGVLGTTQCLRATLEGDWINNTAGPLAPPRIQVVVGGTTVLDTGAAAGNNTVNQGTARGGWTVEIFAVELGAANSQLWRIKQSIALPQGVLNSDNGPFTTGEGNRSYGLGAGSNAIGFAQGFTTSALDMTTSKTFVVNVINGSASASYETKLYGALVEII